MPAPKLARLADAVKRRRAEVARIESGAAPKRSLADKIQSTQARLAKLTETAQKARAQVNRDLMASKASTAFQPMRRAERRTPKVARLLERLKARAASG